jgi:hypothetical protein
MSNKLPAIRVIEFAEYDPEDAVCFFTLRVREEGSP